MKTQRIRFLHPDSTTLRLILSFFLLILPFEILVFFFLSWSKAQMNSEIKASTQASVRYMTQSFEEEIESLYALLNRVTLYSSVTQFARNQDSLSTSDYYIGLLDQLNLLGEYKSIYPLIEDMTIHYPANATTVSSVTGFLTGQKESIQNVLASIRTTPSLLRGSKERIFLSSVYPASTQYTQDIPMLCITLELSHKAIVDYLDTSSQNYDTAMYMHAQGGTVFSSSVQDSSQYIPCLEEMARLVRETPQQNVFSWSDRQYYIIAEYSPYLECSFLQFIPLEEVFRVPDRISSFLLIYSLLSLPAICIFCYIVIRLIVRPMESLMEGYQRVEKGDYTTTLSEESFSLEFRLLLHNFNKMTAHLHQAIDQVTSYRLYSQKMELKQLQMQINPHFLYNTYFILHRLIKSENLEQALALSSYLGRYLQYITRNASDLVPLKKEWEHAENYLRIQDIRYSMRIQFRYDPLPDRYHDFLVPRLILQPLLENALEHGMKYVQEEGFIAMHIVERPDYLEIQVDDNGNSLQPDDIMALETAIHSPDSPDKEYTALLNIHRRLQLVYGNSADLKLTRNAYNGLRVHVLIPFEETITA